MTLGPKEWLPQRWKVTYLDKSRARPSGNPPLSLVWPKDPLQMNQGDQLFIVLVTHTKVTWVASKILRPMRPYDLRRSQGCKGHVVAMDITCNLVTSDGNKGRVVTMSISCDLCNLCDLETYWFQGLQMFEIQPMRLKWPRFLGLHRLH